MEKYEIKVINGVPCALLDDKVVYMGDSVEQLEEMINSGELDRALEMCEVMCNGRKGMY